MIRTISITALITLGMASPLFAAEKDAPLVSSTGLGTQEGQPIEVIVEWIRSGSAPSEQFNAQLIALQFAPSVSIIESHGTIVAITQGARMFSGDREALTALMREVQSAIPRGTGQVLWSVGQARPGI